MAFRPDAGRAVLAALLLGAAGGDSPQQLIGRARADLARSDGIAAEFKIRDALAAGAPRADVSALMGEAQLLQGKLGGAREWLGKGEFAAADAPGGFRALARLERAQGNLKASGQALDRALKLTPGDPELWVDVGRLRYAGGEHLLALEAADKALALGQDDVRALEFKGQIVRDQAGLEAALPWFEKALERAPKDIAVLTEHAATLGDLGRADEAERVIERLLAASPRNPRAFYLQAVLAARAGDTSRARSLLNRANGQLADLPGYLLLDAVLNIRQDNPLLAVQALNRLLAKQPGNLRAHRLMAYALYGAGDYGRLISAYGAEAARPDSPPWLQQLVGQAYAAQGKKALAQPFLNRAAQQHKAQLVPVPYGSQLGQIIASGNLAAAQGFAKGWLASNPGYAPFHAMAGDVALMQGNRAAALAEYRLAARVRVTPVLAFKMKLAAP